MDEPQFACDAMLGTLARWLRFAGFDTSFDPALSDPALAAAARREGRWLLTRDRLLAAVAGPRVVMLRRPDLAGQVGELRSRLALAADPGRAFTRCSRCNGALEPVAGAVVADLVPPYVAANASRFVRCPGCRRVYWPGTHAERISIRVRELFGP
ncbi:MAG: hypothetical protein H6Q02_1104 [Acidobacteria bacterium]|nr:hypothetical protein [Acidobacteriota bacterium]